MNIYGCATSSKIMAVSLLLLMGGIITVDDLINNDTKRARYIGTVLQNFNPEEIGQFFYGLYSLDEIVIGNLVRKYPYSGLQPGINILGILFKIEGYFSGVAPSHFICLYMNDDLKTGYNISSWVGNGVSPMQVTTFDIATLDDHVGLLTNNHTTDISNEKKIEIARFCNDPQANVNNPHPDNVHPDNVFIKSSRQLDRHQGRQYFIFIMPQTFIENILGLAPAPASASAPGFGPGFEPAYDPGPASAPSMVAQKEDKNNDVLLPSSLKKEKQNIHAGDNGDDLATNLCVNRGVIGRVKKRACDITHQAECLY